jgi:beta-phosphoglucomutase family hydrolase
MGARQTGPSGRAAAIPVPPDVRAFVFDLDGVLTGSEHLHRRAWKHLFDDYLRSRHGEAAEPFTDRDYHEYVDGKPRIDGVRSFLAARDITLPTGTPDDEAGDETAWALGNRKNRLFHELLEREGVERYDASIAFVRRLRDRGVPTAVVTSSRNGRRVLAEAGIADLFQVRIDGLDAAELGLPGKPDPATFLEAARRLGAEPGATAVVEDAASGVEAGRRGGFGWVVGVARGSEPGALERAGADVVVAELSELEIEDGGED